MKISRRRKTRQPQSTFEREMTDPAFKEKLEAEYQEFALSEIVLQLMEEEHISVRGLAKSAGISPSVIQDIRSGNRSNITIQNLCKIVKALGSRVAVQIGDHYMPLEG
ncbi:MAG: helix-turn-helix transcriptional regulator [bacterium]